MTEVPAPGRETESGLQVYCIFFNRIDRSLNHILHDKSPDQAALEIIIDAYVFQLLKI